MTTDTFCRKLTELVTASVTEQRLEIVAHELAAHFAVKPHEVGLFKFDSAGRTAAFVWPPQQLANTLKIPVKLFNTALVSTTAQQLRGSIDNAFAQTPHLHMFEQALTEREHRLPLQKVMTAPGLKEDRLQWIIQISRKGHTRDEAGPDFTAEELNRLETVAGCLATLPL